MQHTWLKVNTEDLQAIEQAVATAESRTAGEIVPMIVHESTYSSHVPGLLMLAFFALFMVAMPALGLGGWIWNSVATLTAIILGYVLAQSAWVRRHVIPRHDQALAVLHRAQLEFHETGIPATHGRTGVLIFVSMRERRAVVLGDRAISEKIDAERWRSIVDELIKEMGRGRVKEAFTGAIAHVGEILAREFPASKHDTNELPNTLVVKD